MNAMLVVMILAGAGVLIGSVRAWRSQRRHRMLVIALQIVAAALLVLCLFPPTTQENFAAGEMQVLTPAATPEQLAGVSAGATVIALPGAPDLRGAERVPDLGTALRRHPDLRSLHVIGGGLPARDRDAARGIVTRFDAAALPQGVVDLDAPEWVDAGSVWRLGGRVERVAQGRIEFRDPADVVVAAAPLDADGRFQLHAQAKVAGASLFSLRVLDKDGARIDEIALPLVARAGQPLKIVLLAGAPDPELKYLRRWAVDAGLQLDSRVNLSEGIALTEGSAALDAEALRGADVAIIDERAWATLTAAQKQALTTAVHEGLGVLLRVTGALPAAVTEDWAALGFRTQASAASSTATFDHALGLGDAGLALTRQALQVDAGDATPLLRADDDAPVALWRSEGRGRVGLWWLADSYRLSLGGAQAQFGTLWSAALTTLARARGEKTPQLPREARVDERAVLCNVAAGASVETGQHARVELSIDSTGATAGCAAYWPTQAGWHTLVSGDQRWPFHVRAATEAVALQRADDARATRALITMSAAPAQNAQREHALPRWPFYLGWLAAVALLWWLERRSPREPA
jgi:hypothetical protein